MLSSKSSRFFSNQALRFLFSTAALSTNAQRAIWASKFISKITQVQQAENITDPSMIEQLKKLEIPTTEFTIDPSFKEEMILAFKNGVALNRPFFNLSSPSSTAAQTKTDIYPNSIVTRQLFVLLAKQEKEKCIYGRRGLDKIASYALFHYYSSIASQYQFESYNTEEYTKLMKEEFIGSFPKTLYCNPLPKSDEELKVMILDQSPEIPSTEKAALLQKPYLEFVPAYRKYYLDKSIKLQAVMPVEEKDDKEKLYYDFLRRFGEIGCERVYMSDTTLTPNMFTKSHLDFKTKSPLEITISHANCFQNKWGDICVHQHAWFEIKKVLESKGFSQQKMINLRSIYIEMGLFLRQSSGSDNWCGISDFQDTRDMVAMLLDDKTLNDSLKQSIEKDEFEQFLRSMVKKFSAKRRQQYCKALGYFLDNGTNAEREIKFELAEKIYLRAVKLKREGTQSTGIVVDVNKLTKFLEKNDADKNYSIQKLLKSKVLGQQVFPIEISITPETRIGKFAMNPSEFVAVYRDAMKQPLLKMVGLVEGDINHYEKRAPFANEPKKAAAASAAPSKPSKSEKIINEVNTQLEQNTMVMKMILEQIGLSANSRTQNQPAAVASSVALNQAGQASSVPPATAASASTIETTQVQQPIAHTQPANPTSVPASESTPVPPVSTASNPVST